MVSGGVGHRGPPHGLTDTSSSPSSWTRSMSPCRWGLVGTTPRDRGTCHDHAAQPHALEEEAEVLADLPADHELVGACRARACGEPPAAR